MNLSFVSVASLITLINCGRFREDIQRLAQSDYYKVTRLEHNLRYLACLLSVLPSGDPSKIHVYEMKILNCLERYYPLADKCPRSFDQLYRSYLKAARGLHQRMTGDKESSCDYNYILGMVDNASIRILDAEEGALIDGPDVFAEVDGIIGLIDQYQLCCKKSPIAYKVDSLLQNPSVSFVLLLLYCLFFTRVLSIFGLHI